VLRITSQNASETRRRRTKYYTVSVDTTVILLIYRYKSHGPNTTPAEILLSGPRHKVLRPSSSIVLQLSIIYVRAQ